MALLTVAESRPLHSYLVVVLSASIARVSVKTNLLEENARMSDLYNFCARAPCAVPGDWYGIKLLLLYAKYYARTFIQMCLFNSASGWNLSIILGLESPTRNSYISVRMVQVRVSTRRVSVFTRVGVDFERLKVRSVRRGLTTPRHQNSTIIPDYAPTHRRTKSYQTKPNQTKQNETQINA